MMRARSRSFGASVRSLALRAHMPRTEILVLMLVPLLVPGCGGLGAVVPLAMKIGKDLLGTATENYSPKYGKSLEELINALVTAPSTATTASAVSQAPQGKALAIEFAILKEVTSAGRSSLVAIEDGATLRDGDGDSDHGDKFKISLRSAESCYVYILAIDSTGWVTTIFPGAETGATNPVDPGRTYLVPEGSRWYALDEQRGIEHVYMLASYVRRPDLEQMQANFAQMVRPERTQYRHVEEAAVATRGIVAVGPGRPTEVAGDAGDVHEVTPTSFLADVKGFDLVVTRWFVHE